MIRASSQAVLLSMALLSTNASAAPKELAHGFWYETYKGVYTYIVDANAQLCYYAVSAGSGVGTTLVPCESLARREEWKPVIAWAVKPEAK